MPVKKKQRRGDEAAPQTSEEKDRKSGMRREERKAI